MKKYVLALVMVLVVCQLAAAQSVKSIFNEFKHRVDVEYINFPPYFMRLGKLFMGTDEDSQFAKKIDSIRILDLGDSPEEVRSLFIQRVANMNRKGYNTWKQVGDVDERMHLMTKGKGNDVNEVVIIFAEEDNCTLIQMTCKIKREDVVELVSEQLERQRERR